MKSKIYWIGVEYDYNENAPDIGDLKGGFVYGFVKAYDAQKALNSLLNEFKDKKLEAKDVEFISPYDEDMEWETKDDTIRYLKLYREAMSSNQMVFDDFYAYEKE